MRPDNNLELKEELKVMRGYDTEEVVFSVNGLKGTVEVGEKATLIVGGVDVMEALRQCHNTINSLKDEIERLKRS